MPISWKLVKEVMVHLSVQWECMWLFKNNKTISPQCHDHKKCPKYINWEKRVAEEGPIFTNIILCINIYVCAHMCIMLTHTHIYYLYTKFLEQYIRNCWHFMFGWKAMAEVFILSFSIIWIFPLNMYYFRGDIL